MRSESAYGNIEKLDGDDTEEGPPPVPIEMLPLRGGDGSLL
jgi:hypothetical protein